MSTIQEDNANTFESARQEHEFEVKAEKMLMGQREVPNGRNFLSWTMRYQQNDKYRANFDSVFPNSPGAGL